jgi:hypothetical protein
MLGLIGANMFIPKADRFSMMEGISISSPKTLKEC